MNIVTRPLGMIQANCYILETNEKRALVLDPGGDAGQVIRYLEENGLTLGAILLTHGHHDHVAAVWDLLDWQEAPVYVPEQDLEMLEDISLSLCGMAPLYFHYRQGVPYRTLQEGDVVRLDDISLRVIHTPGHTKGSSCYLGDGALFTGDTLFEGSVGRTDLYGGSYPTLKASLEKLSSLEGDYTVYPGHGGATTLELQRRTNPYLGQVDYDDYF